MCISAEPLWPAVDVGGTTIRVVLVADRGDGGPEPVVRLEVPTPRGLDRLIEALRETLLEASKTATAEGNRVAKALAIGTPGRLEPDAAGNRVIAPRSATNLEAFPGEMDGVDLAAVLADALDLPRDRVFWDNDAVVQGRHLIGELLRDPATTGHLHGQVVVCINPGTGLGGCIAEVAGDGSIEVFTDSHISELLLHPVELERPLGGYHAAARSTPDGSTIDLDLRLRGRVSGVRLDSPVGKQAEDFLSGTGLELIAAGLEGCAAELVPSGSLFDEPEASIDGALLSELVTRGTETTAACAARFVGDLGGRALMRLLVMLRDGTAAKSPGFPDWSPADLDRLRGVSRFVLGGGITKTELGQRMITGARNTLCCWDDLQLYEMDYIADDAGALGAFSLIPRHRVKKNTAR
jgi:hypothetical protein